MGGQTLSRFTRRLAIEGRWGQRASHPKPGHGLLEGAGRRRSAVGSDARAAKGRGQFESTVQSRAPRARGFSGVVQRSRRFSVGRGVF